MSKELLESWPLNDGGTSGILASDLEDGTIAQHRWGVYLNNNTFGRSLDFSTAGSGAYAENTKVNLAGDFSISVWIMAPVRDGQERVIFSQGNEDTTTGKLYLAAETQELTFSSDDITGLVSSGVSLADGQWHHVLISRKGKSFSYYIDGKRVKKITVKGTPPKESPVVYIGSDVNLSNSFDGTLAEIRIFGEAVTPGRATHTVIDTQDNQTQKPRLDLKQGMVIDRRQYLAPTPLPHEGQTVREQDIVNIINMGFDHVKLLLTPNHLIREDGSLIEENMEYISTLLNWITEYKYKCILCIHPEDDFKPTYLGNLDNFEIMLKWYGELAAYIGERWDPDTLALQLMTEPGANNRRVKWTWMSDRMWGTVRNVLPEHTILTSSDMYGNIELLKQMSPATDSNLIYTFTTYEPYTIGWYYYGVTTPNGIDAWGYIKNIPYPVEEGVDYTQAIEEAIELVPDTLKAKTRKELWAYIEGKYDGKRANFINRYDSLYNAEWHMLRAESLDEWRKKYGGNIHIMCVEFGCMDRLTPVKLFHSAVEGSGIPDADRIQFVHDMRIAFDTYNIGWSYWSYNEAHTIFLPEEHIYGDSPLPDDAKAIFDKEMIEYGLGVKIPE